ncbi:MAG: hypothetical protein M3Y33_12475 [Actinomycetota bacterium]|nr:hypothetical protein [Actinomycetota bacterium]
MLDVPAVIPRDNQAAATGRFRDGHPRSLNEHLPHRLEQDVPADILGTGQVGAYGYAAW